MALSSRREPELVDLTLDSDFDSEDDIIVSETASSRAAYVSLAPARRPSYASTPATRPSTPPVPLPGSASNAHSEQSAGVQSRKSCTPTGRATNASSSTSTTTIASPANMGRNASTSQDVAAALLTAPSAARTSTHVENSAKRRKLTTLDRPEVGQNKIVKQSSTHGDAAPTLAQNVAGSSRNTNLGAKLNNMNGAPSVHFMNAALKPTGLPVPVLDDVLLQAHRPLPIGRLSEDHAMTGLLSPGLTTTPESEVVVIDSDDEPELVQPSLPHADRATEASVIRHESDHGLQSRAALPSGNMLNASVRTQSLRRSFSPPPAPHHDRNTASSGLAVRQPTPRKMQQISETPRVPLAVLPTPPATTKPSCMTKTNHISEQADHLLIFLKEVKKLKWTDITAEFNREIPRRSYVQLQSRYSQTLNRRDRTQDPPTLNLPARFAAEATVDWQTVHADIPGPSPRIEVAGLSLNGMSQQNEYQNSKPRAVQQIRDHDKSSGTDSGPQRQRSRRTAPVDYTWAKLGTRFAADELEGDVSDEKCTPRLKSRLNAPIRSESPADGTLVVSEPKVATQTKLLEMNFHAKDSLLGLATGRGLRSVQQERMPYLSLSQRIAMREGSEEWTWDQTNPDWQGAVLHVDFSSAELQIVENVVGETVKSARRTRHSTYRRHLRAVLKKLAEPRLQQLAYEIARHLRSRGVQSIKSFLQDAATGKLSEAPQIQRYAAASPNTKLSSIQRPSIPAVIRQRELGFQSRRGWRTASSPLTYQTKNRMMDTIGPKYTWTGASSDVHTVAWSPKGQHFAAGAVAVTDVDSMQYNRPNNLLFGNAHEGTIHELGEHRIDRTRTDNGANSTHAMYVSQDPNLYTTVSSVAFSPSGDWLYSAGYDKTVCVWDTSLSRLITSLKHNAEVDILAVNPPYEDVIATASKQTTNDSIKLVRLNQDVINDASWKPTVRNFASAKAMSRPDLKMTVNALQFNPIGGSVLLAGFGANLCEDSGLDTTGDICLWDVEYGINLHVHGSSRNVFDVTFNPNPRKHCLFAVGCVASGNVNRGTRSVVRFYTTKGAWNDRDRKHTCPVELECKAYDMNDIVWCPHDENLFAAGCTDGRSYVWDLRVPHKVLYTLSHGSSIMPLQDDIPHDQTDTGVRFLSWGQNATRLYSGSSDGVVKVWDVTRSREDTFVKDLTTTTSGIMSGAFSADYSKLILGEVNGSAHVLEVGRDDFTLKDADKLQYYPYYSDKAATSIHLETDVAAAEAREWLETGRLQSAPMSGMPKRQVVQGPNYDGPFDQGDNDHTMSLREQASVFQRKMAAASGPQCKLPACLDSTNTTTYEEVGDSGRSAERIPDELRQQWLDESVRTIAGKSQCAACGRPALPSLDADSTTLCERCSFSCFRCGGSACVAGTATTLECYDCAGVWSVGALGYECDQEPKFKGTPLNVPPIRGFEIASYMERMEDVDTTFGDEMNALTDYYLGLAIDRPQSPPL
ncbi:uncharacterized protein EKO05_0008487 [Ascochyta rabiei]|uniref:Uncharacterized protein n=1 Tax=Didymella rabiei TaxID=5454 RepID=A0A163H838_DIDRA|nr:uncharacterized protein EKO05_0008487 [Ascochyta rabiei]KZM25199.1 hypothetical protein ST47_g3687 [Ascochyta rabiei]UPX18181.1 hypothetical protein EKO05_0008487 [Ascochyta rabiei]